ncbi:sensor histidine kinase [Brevibacillus dissolubilis]|uniref:sensor histidine kinase n=1 Tax=Brevibacillus dissolubilis TaxID=1844116 RepID=UPI001116B2E8|nr:HAMP domain-containing sensor histidine kinase [Brevibacillus dissolubilis]
MKIGNKIFLAFLAVIVVHILAYQLVFQDMIVEQIKNDRHEQFMQEKRAAERVSFIQLMRTNVFKDPMEMRELTERLPDDLMYKVTVEDANGHPIFTKESNSYSIKGKGKKKIVAEYYFQRQPPYEGRTVIQFYTDDHDILASKGVSMIVFFMYGSIIMIGLALLFILVRWILNPVNELSRVIQDIKSGKRSVTYHYKSNDEFGQVFHYFSDMVSELRTSEERQQELIAAIAHDFRTPLTTIKGYASYIGTGRVTNIERIQKQMKKIEEKADDLEHLLSELQDHVQLSNPDSPLNKSRVHVHPFISDIAEDYGRRTADANLTFTCKIRVTNDLYMEVDEHKMRRVLENLLNNAIYYNKPEGSILLTCDQQDQNLIISVIDKGEGISDDDLPKIFTKFYRAEKSRNRNSGGTGLGLTICQSIVGRHGGQIHVTSQLGVGSSFTITIPLHALS